MTVTKILAGAAAATAEYFANLEATGDYYVNEDGDPYAEPGRWMGKLAAVLGQRGQLEVEELLRILDGRHPQTGARLGRRWKTRECERIAAHDACWSVPGSVSAGWASSTGRTKAAIQEAHDEAVTYAFAHIERHAKVVRRRDRTKTNPATGISPMMTETAAGLIAARFEHHTARQTAAQAAVGMPPDPQLHTHCLIFLAQRHDGQVVAVTSEVLKKAMREGGAVYRSRLAANLERLGFTIERQTGKDRRYFEISGVPQSLQEEWSSRSREITAGLERWRVEFLAEYGRAPTHLEERAWSLTQRVKKGRWHRGQLDDAWRTVAAYHGFGPEAVEALREQLPPQAGPAGARTQLLVKELLGPDGLTATDAAFTLRMLRVRAYEWSAGLLDAPQVEAAIAAVQRHGDVIPIDEELWTTRQMLDLERGVQRWKADRGLRSRSPTPSGRTVAEAVLRAIVPLSGEQRRALRAMLRGQTTCVTGEAGTGKGVVLGVAAEIWHRQRRRVFALAVGGAQAQRLGADLGPAAVPLSIDAFTYRVKSGRIRLRDSDVITIDEAGQVDTRRWAALAASIGLAPQVVALGDEAQLAPLSAGGLWPQFAAGGAHLSEVFRTRVEWERTGWAQLRGGDAIEAYRLYARHGYLTILPTRADAVAAALDAFDADGRTGLLITDASNWERHQINGLAQARKLAAGELGEVGVDVDGAYGVTTLRRGDRVQFEGQWRPPVRGQPRVQNRTVADVLAVDAERRVVLVRSREAIPRLLQVDVAAYRGLELHYAMHVQTGQGATVDRTYVIAGGWQTHRQSMYVAASRSRYGTQIFLDHVSLGRSDATEALEEAARRASTSREKVAATTLLARSRRRTPRVLRPLIIRYQQRQDRRQANREARAREEARAQLADTTPSPNGSPARSTSWGWRHWRVGTASHSPTGGTGEG